MHARVDLPHDPDDVDDVVEALLGPRGATACATWSSWSTTTTTTVADEAAWSVHEEFTAAGIGVREVLRVHDDHWYAVLPGAPLAAYRGVPFTRADHPFTARPSSRGGSPTPAGRRCAGDPRAGRRGGRGGVPHLADAPLRRRRPRGAGPPPRPRRGHLLRDRARLRRRHVRTGERRDEAWAWLDRAEARAAVELWSDAAVVPATHVAGSRRRAGVRGVAGRRRRPGVVRRRPVRGRASPPTRWPGLVAELLESATPPDSWATLRPRVGASGDPAA